MGVHGKEQKDVQKALPRVLKQNTALFKIKAPLEKSKLAYLSLQTVPQIV